MKHLAGERHIPSARVRRAHEVEDRHIVGVGPTSQRLDALDIRGERLAGIGVDRLQTRRRMHNTVNSPDRHSRQGIRQSALHNRKVALIDMSGDIYSQRREQRRETQAALGSRAAQEHDDALASVQQPAKHVLANESRTSRQECRCGLVRHLLQVSASRHRACQHGQSPRRVGSYTSPGAKTSRPIIWKTSFRSKVLRFAVGESPSAGLQRLYRRAWSIHCTFPFKLREPETRASEAVGYLEGIVDCGF